MSKAQNRQKLQTAFSYHQGGNLTRAVELYRDVLKTDPDNIHALHYLGIVEASAGKPESAKSFIARSLSGHPPNIPYLENYATILCQAGDYQSAIQACQEGLRLAPRSASLLYVSAVSLLKLCKLVVDAGTSRAHCSDAASLRRPGR
jgi:protein O-GlcNAc transferase